MIITLLSVDINWEEKEYNLKKFSEILRLLDYKSDIIIFPEMFSTGFTMNPSMMENMDGVSLNWLKNEAHLSDSVLIASIPIEMHNRLIFMRPDGTFEYYDKRHLFRMGDEIDLYKPGTNRRIVNYKEVNFSLNICYDIRFPIWSRNIENEYDVLIYISNFPDSRIEAAHTLAKARAIENMSYVLFVNRIGNDPISKYSASSIAIDYKGNSIGTYITSNELEKIMPGIQVVKVEIDTIALQNFREKFPAWKDADKFILK